MTRVLQRNKANLTAASKQKKTRIPTKQVQCQTCGQRKHSDRFTRAGWKSHGTCRACQAKKRGLVAFEPDDSDAFLVTLDSWGVLKVSRISVFRFLFCNFTVLTIPVCAIRRKHVVALLITEGVMDRRFKRTQRTKGSTLC